MNRQARQLTEKIVASLKGWVKEIVAEAPSVTDEAGVRRLETRIAQEGQRHLAGLLQDTLQLAVDGLPEARRCPRCGGRRRHKGRRWRRPLSRLGGIRLEGVYWYCEACGRGDHAATPLVKGTLTAWMRELLTLLGVALVSFEKASVLSAKVLGVRVDAETIRTLTLREGVRQEASGPRASPPVVAGQDLVVSCDGTMVHTRESGWREVKAYLLEHAGGRLGGAYLEEAEVFMPRVRRAAACLEADRARRIFFLSDAAAWIEKGARVQLPQAVRIVDLWHARQHLYAAGAELYARDEAKGRRWAERWGRRLREDGGRVVLHYLKRSRLRSRRRQRALRKLLVYLHNQADRLDYPTYEARGWPISSGPMESFCKQLGRRLKGPGMRWRHDHVDPMASMVTLWIDGRWDTYWHTAA